MPFFNLGGGGTGGGGSSDGVTQQFAGQIAQVLWYRRALSATEVLFVSRWLGRLYGVTV